MKKIQTFIYVLLMGVCFAACQEDDFGGSAQGGIRIALADGTTGVDVTTRSTPSELFAGFKEKFKFQIKGDNYDQTHNWTDDVIPLAAGVYDITATCGTEQADGVVEFDKPCYTGTKEGQKVNPGETATTVEIPCEVTNALVSIQFGDEYKEFAEKAYAQISVRQGDSDGQRWDPLTTSAYFKAGSSLTKLKIYKDDDDSLGADILDDVISDSNFPETFKAGDHLIITLSVAKKDGNVAIKVSKVELKEVTIEETIPMEWLPKPKMAVEGFDATTKMLSMYESETPTAKFNFNLSSGLQELKFTLDFKDEEYKSLNKAYTLSKLSQEDKTALTGAGVILPSIGDKGNVALDFSGLAAKLTGSTEGDALDNVIKLTEVKANNRVLEGGEQTYTIKTHAPEFGIKVYPGNTWTKQFTANTEITKGNAEVIRKGMTFEYSTNGSNWTSSDSIVIGLTKNTSYKIRSKYGKHISKEVEVITYDEIPLTNGGLEGGTITKGEDSNGSQYGAVYIWSGWSTLNELTCDDTHAFIWGNTAFNSRSGTRPAAPRGGSSGSQSAWIMTMGYGYGGTDGPNIITPSELFLGTLTDVNHSEDTATKNYGIGYKSRPTGLKFYYKYAPYNGDKSDIYIQVKGVNGEILGSASLNETNTVSSFTEVTLNIEYNEEYMNLEPETLVIVFKSGFNSDVKDYETWSLMGGNSAEPSHRGSELYIDDIQLIYDK